MTFKRWLPTFLALPDRRPPRHRDRRLARQPRSGGVAACSPARSSASRQWLALRSHGIGQRWIAHTAAGDGHAAARSPRPSPAPAPSVADLMRPSLVTGAAVGAAQSALLARGAGRRGVDGHHRRELVARLARHLAGHRRPRPRPPRLRSSGALLVTLLTPALPAPPTTSASCSAIPRRSRARRARAPAAAQTASTSAATRWWPTPSPWTIAPESPSIRCLSGSASAASLDHARRVLGVVEDAGDEDQRQERGVHVGGRRVEVRDRVRERDAERRRSRRRRARRRRSASRSCGQSSPNSTLAGDRDDHDLHDRVGDRAADDPGQVGRRRQRRAAHALEDPELAQRRDVEGERVEGRRHHRHPGDPRDDHLQHVAVVVQQRAEEAEEQQRQHEVEERRARVAPEHLALEPVLAPGQAAPAARRAAVDGGAAARPRSIACSFTRRPRPSARGRPLRGSGA